MKSVLVLVLSSLMISVQAWSDALSPQSDIILHYRYGNQVKLSTLQIFNNGTVLREEMECCPPREILSTTYKMPSAGLKKLEGLVAAVASGKTTVKSHRGAYGEQYGLLVVYPSSDSSVIVRSKHIDQYEENDSASAVDLIQLVNAFVSVKMPDHEQAR